MEQTSSKTEADSLEDKESLYESPPDLFGVTSPDAEDYPPKEEDGVIVVKVHEHEGNTRAKKYSKITDEQRRDFINAVENDGERIIHAAKRFDINYSSAKSILNVFKSEGRSIKKQFRDNPNRNPKDMKGESKGSFMKNLAAGDKPNVEERVVTTNNASTQTMSDPTEEGNSLLALRDRLLATKTDKRQNPYEALSSHEFTRFSGSLSDYSESQFGSDPNNTTRGGAGGQIFNLGANSNQSFMSQQNVQKPDSLGYANVPQNYQFFQQGGGGPGMMQDSPSIYQQPGPPKQQESQNYNSMVYSGVNPVQYFVMNPSNDQMTGNQMGQQQQYQFLQPIMYFMPTTQNVQMKGNMNQPYVPPHQNNLIIYNQNQNQNNSEQNQKGGGPYQYPNMDKI